MLLIISLASSILVVTGLSLSSIVSNMKVGSGGAYFIISRVLGIESGSAIGILLCVSQLSSVALCVTGFSLSIQQFFPHFSINVIEATTLTTLIVISYISTQLAVKTQALIFITLFVSIGSIFFGSGQGLAETLPPPEDLSIVTLTFWTGFAMFFPAATGIEAGMSMSGDLQNPSRAIPIGTIASILTAYLLYTGIALFLSNEVSSDILRKYPFIVYHLSKVKILVMIGVWGATLSSALGSILGAPRVIQALAKDRVLPSFLSKGFGKTNQPRIAILFVYGAAMTLTLFTNINQIIPIMTMICLASYGLINFVAFFESFIKNPSWRPNFVTPWPVALLGSVCCFAVMFLINATASLIVICLGTILFVIASYRKIESGWDDIRYSLFSYLVHKGAAKLSSMKPNAKSWRPNLLSLFDAENLSSNFILFANALDHGKGFLTFTTNVSKNCEKEMETRLKQKLSDLKVPSFLHLNYSENTPSNILQQIKNYGFGPLIPNTAVIPMTTDQKAIAEILNDIGRIKKNIVILKHDDGNPRLYSQPYVTPKKINLWWRGGNQKNFELCLALSYCLRGSPTWSGSEMHIKSIVKDEEEKEKLTHLFERYKEKLRIKNVKFTPIIDEEGNFFSNLVENSKDADFTFLGIRPKREEESDKEYAKCFNEFVQVTEPVPNIAYVKAGEELSFAKIFS